PTRRRPPQHPHLRPPAVRDVRPPTGGRWPGRLAALADRRHRHLPHLDVALLNAERSRGDLRLWATKEELDRLETCHDAPAAAAVSRLLSGAPPARLPRPGRHVGGRGTGPGGGGRGDDAGVPAVVDRLDLRQRPRMGVPGGPELGPVPAAQADPRVPRRTPP